MAQRSHDLLELITSSEEIRTVDLIYLHTLRNRQMLKVAKLEVALLFLWINLVADNLDICSLCHTTHKEQTCADKTHLDGDGKIEDHRQQECHPKHDDIALWILQDR